MWARTIPTTYERQKEKEHRGRDCSNVINNENKDKNRHQRLVQKHVRDAQSCFCMRAGNL